MRNVEETAREYVVDRALDVAIYRPGPTRADDLAELIKKDIDVSAPFVQEVLDESPRFEGFQGTYDPAYRRDLASRPMGGALSTILQVYGRPMPRYLLASEMSHTKKGSPDYFARLLDGALEAAGLCEPDGRYVCDNMWIYEHMPDLEMERVLFLNRLDEDEVLADVLDTCTKESLGSRSLTDTAENVLQAAETPLSNRALGFLVGYHQGERYDAAELLRQMLDEDEQRFMPIAGPRWILTEWLDDIEKAARKQSPPEEEDDYEVDIVEMLEKDVPPDKRYELTDGDVEAIMTVVERSRTPFTIEGILADILELTPNQHKYPRAAQAVDELLKSEQSITELDPGRFLRLGAVPSWARVVPKVLVPPRWEPQVNEDWDLLSEDVILQLEGLAEEVLEDVQDPVYDDIGEKYVAPVDETEAAAGITYPVMNHHHGAGTMKIRVIDRAFFADEDDLTMIELVCDDDRLLNAWLNKDTELLYGLRAWYQDNLPPSGAIISIEKTDSVGRYRLSWDEETDALTYIGRESLDELENWDRRLADNPMSLKDLIAVLIDEDNGAPFNTLWAHLNILRRVSRTQLASVLSFFPCFEHGEGNRWYLDADRLDEGYDQDKIDYVVGLEAAIEEVEGALAEKKDARHTSKSDEDDDDE